MLVWCLVFSGRRFGLRLIRCGLGNRLVLFKDQIELIKALGGQAKAKAFCPAS